MDHWVNEGIRLLKTGNRLEAERALRIAISENGRSVEAWLWLSQTVESDVEKMTCLLKVLELDPRSIVARQQLASLQQRGRTNDAQHVDPFKLEESPIEEAATATAPKDSLFSNDSDFEIKVKSRRVFETIDFGRIFLIALIVLVVAVIVAALFIFIK